MRRREFITLLGGAATAWPLATRGQQPERMRRIGILMGAAETDVEAQGWIAAFQQRLRELGWNEGHNIGIDYRWAGGDARRIQTYAAELMGFKPDVVVAHAPAVLAAVRQATLTIPIVFLSVADPVGGGFVASLAAPGGNITGFTNYEFTIGGKWLETLKQIAPRVSRVMVILNPANPTGPGYVRMIETAGASFAVQVTATPVPDTPDYERVIESFAREPNGGLIVLPDSRAGVERERIIALAARHRLPAVYYVRYFATAGGLLSYGPETADQYRRAAAYVDRILKGEKPANLPVEGATKFKFVINLKTAKALGLEVSDRLLTAADEVIE